MGLLKRCEAHPDPDVRKVSGNVLYIMQAPELKIDEDMFVRIDADALQATDDWNRRRDVEDKDKPPEKYSIEWFQQNYRKRPPPKQQSMAPLYALGAATLSSFALLLARQPPL